jgi:heptosyltransferase-2
VEFSNILIRATNWVGDAVMCLPALRCIRGRFPSAQIAILAKPVVADLYQHESCADEVIPYETTPRQIAAELCSRKFDCAILLQNAFEAAWIAWLARIPNRIGYDRDARGFLLTVPVRVPKRGEIPRHERFYYLELLRRARLIEGFSDEGMIRLQHMPVTPSRIIGVSPGAAYGNAKRWLPERFAEAASKLACTRGSSISVFGSASERDICERIATMLKEHKVENYAGRTTLAQFIDLAARCEIFLTNDSGAMHIVSALGVPTVAVFGATDDTATGPTGPNARVVREAVECSPCLLRECPIDHRCMTHVTADRVVKEALSLLID